MYRHNHREVFLPNFCMSEYHGIAGMTCDVSVMDVVMRPSLPKFIVVRDEDFDFIKGLELMVGTELNVSYVWDWFDKCWDQHHDKMHHVPMDNQFYRIVSTEHNMRRYLDRPQMPDQLRQTEMERRRFRDHKIKPYFDQRESFYVPALLPERKVRWTR